MRLLPEVSDLSRPYWEAVRRGELVAQYCPGCARFRHPPTPRCPDCHGEDVEWRPLAGTGVVYTMTTVHQAAHRGFADAVPYRIGIVELDEGVRFVTDFPGDEPLAIGDRVAVRFRPHGEDHALPYWVAAP